MSNFAKVQNRPKKCKNNWVNMTLFYMARYTLDMSNPIQAIHMDNECLKWVDMGVPDIWWGCGCLASKKCKNIFCTFAKLVIISGRTKNAYLITVEYGPHSD